MTCDGPMVSVVIPTHNRADLIGETIQSVLEQTVEDFEILVVDNGSTDNTQQVVSEIDDSRVKYFRQENTGGPAGPRNTGIGRAQGKYIAFLDSDDLWLPHKLERQVKYLEKNSEVGLAYGQSILFGDDQSEGFVHPSRARSGRIFEALFLSSNFIPCLTVIIRKEVLAEVGHFDEDPGIKTVEDFDLWLRISKRYPVYFFPEILARQRIHQSNLGSFDAERWFQLILNLARKFRARGWIGRSLFTRRIWWSGWAAMMISVRRAVRERNFNKPIDFCGYLFKTLLSH